MNSLQHSARHLLLPLYLVGVNTSVWQRGNRSSGELACLAPGSQLSQDANPGWAEPPEPGPFPHQPLNTWPQLRGSFAIPPVHWWVVLSRSANTHMAIKCQG